MPESQGNLKNFDQKKAGDAWSRNRIIVGIVAFLAIVALIAEGTNLALSIQGAGRQTTLVRIVNCQQVTINDQARKIAEDQQFLRAIRDLFLAGNDPVAQAHIRQELEDQAAQQSAEDSQAAQQENPIVVSCAPKNLSSTTTSTARVPTSSPATRAGQSTSSSVIQK